MPVIYRTTVRSVGPEAASFLAESMLVTFGDNAPEELRDFCYTLSAAACSQQVTASDRLVIDGVGYPITAIGDVAQKNLDSLGHVTLVFDGAIAPRMDGCIHVRAGNPPTLHEGSTITIETP